MRKPTPLKLAIVASGRTQREIAEMVGIDEDSLSKIANGHRTPSLPRAIKLANLLDTSVTDLFDVHDAAVSTTDQLPADAPEIRRAA